MKANLIKNIKKYQMQFSKNLTIYKKLKKCKINWMILRTNYKILKINNKKKYRF